MAGVAATVTGGTVVAIERRGGHRERVRGARRRRARDCDSRERTRARDPRRRGRGRVTRGGGARERTRWVRGGVRVQAANGADSRGKLVRVVRT